MNVGKHPSSECNNPDSSSSFLATFSSVRAVTHDLENDLKMLKETIKREESNENHEPQTNQKKCPKCTGKLLRGKKEKIFDYKRRYNCSICNYSLLL